MDVPDAVTIYLWKEQLSPFCGFFLSGLLTYCKSARIPVRVARISELLDGPRSASVLPSAAFLFSGRFGKQEKYALLDLRDQHDQWIDLRISVPVQYFKRCAMSAGPTNIQPFGTVDVKPMAPMFGVATRVSKLWLSKLQLDDGFLPMHRRLPRDLYDIWTIAPPRAFESTPPEKVAQTVLLQTRLWDSNGVSDFSSVNQFRIELVEALSRTFGQRFVGGLVGNSAARLFAPHLIVSGLGATHAYPANVRKAAIGIYTRGLFNSVAFKLAEYFAGSCAVVGEHVSATFRRPLVNQQDFVVADTVDKIVESCDFLLCRQSAMRDLQHAAHDYYNAEIRPDVQVARIVSAMSQSEY